MFRLFKRLRSGKKEEPKKEKAESTNNSDSATTKAGDQASIEAPSSSSMLHETGEQVALQSQARQYELKNSDFATSAQERADITDESEVITSSTSPIHQSITPEVPEENASSALEAEHILSDLEVAQEEAAILEELVVEETPTFTPDELVEAVLFAAGRPLRLEEIVEATELDSTEIKRAITRLKKKLSKNSAFYIKEVSNELWVLQLKSKFRPIAALLREEQPLFSEDELLVLTHIAYRQPISQAVLAKILSYKIDPARVRQIINSLYLKEYVTMEKKARSIILRVTEKFCSEFGFDTDQRRMKIQLIWRLKRQMRQVS